MNNEEKRSMKLEEKNRKFAGKNENFEKKTICSRAIPCIWASLSFTMLGRYIHSVGWRGDTLSIYAMSRPIQKEHQKAIIFMARKLQNHPCSTPTAFTPLSQVRGKYGGIRGAARRRAHLAMVLPRPPSGRRPGRRQAACPTPIY